LLPLSKAGTPSINIAKPITIFYGINFLKVKQLPENAAYFHAHWNRNNLTKRGKILKYCQK
jgi:hypothetical protein